MAAKFGQPGAAAKPAAAADAVGRRPASRFDILPAHPAPAAAAGSGAPSVAQTDAAAGAAAGGHSPTAALLSAAVEQLPAQLLAKRAAPAATAAEGGRPPTSAALPATVTAAAAAANGQPRDSLPAVSAPPDATVALDGSAGVDGATAPPAAKTRRPNPRLTAILAQAMSPQAAQLASPPVETSPPSEAPRSASPQPPQQHLPPPLSSLQQVQRPPAEPTPFDAWRAGAHSRLDAIFAQHRAHMQPAAAPSGDAPAPQQPDGVTPQQPPAHGRCSVS